MIVAITTNGGELDSPVEGQFDKSHYFIFYDTDLGEITDLADNPLVESYGEEGQEAGQVIVEHDAQALLTGEIDPDAGDVLAEGGVEAYICTDGTVRSAIERFLTGDLELRPGPSRGICPGPGSAETPHSRTPSPGSDPGREETDTAIIGIEVKCICPLCGTVIEQGVGGASCELMHCPHCGSNMVRHETIE